MKKIVINRRKGYLLNDLQLNEERISFLKSKGLIKELSSSDKKKYKDKYFLLEEGYSLLNLDNLEERYSIYNEYLRLKKDRSVKNKKFILDNMEELNSLKISYPSEIVFYKGQLYDLEFLKKYFEIIKNDVYDNGIFIGKLIKMKNVYTLDI